MEKRTENIPFRMYAVINCHGNVIATTVAYSRTAALKELYTGEIDRKDWAELRRNGYRTVMLSVKIEP